jgi:hypothetical protein
MNGERVFTVLCCQGSAACYRTHRAKPHTHLRGDRRQKHQFWRVHEVLRAGIAVAISRRVAVVNGIDGEAIPPTER